MASNFANLVLILSIFFSFLSNFFYFKNKLNFSIKLFNISSILSIFSFFLLLYFFSISEFSIAAVYENSHSLKPFFYKIAGTWGNHEGSLLLFVIIIAIFGSLFTFCSNKKEIEFIALVIFFQNNIFLIFLLFLVTTSNPFDLIIPRPNEGLGLNPILQDPLLIIHPPMLYLGYVGFSLTLSLVLAALVKKRLNSEWAKKVWPWVMISWVFLTVGIGLGSIWAYYELGWGGYWFWDPVENASLMPWLAATALIHTLLVLKSKNEMKNWTALLSILTFSFSLLGTFLVRSGVLNSVHAFANDPERGVFILVIIFLITFTALAIQILCSEKTKKFNHGFFSKESFININNLFLLFFLFVILLGTLYPIILSIFNETVSIGPVYYNTLLAPFVFIFLTTMSAGPVLKWSQNVNAKNVKFLLPLLFISTIASILIVYLSVTHNLIFFLGILGSLILIFTIIYETLFEKKYLKTYFSARLITHLGVGVLFLSIFLNAFLSKSDDFEIKLGESKKVENVTFKYLDQKIAKLSNYVELETTFELIDDRYNLVLNPSVRRYLQPNQVTSETSIKSKLLSDYYIAINFPEKNTTSLGVRYHFNFLIYGIWIGIVLMVIGGFVSANKKKY